MVRLDILAVEEAVRSVTREHGDNRRVLCR